MTHSEIQSPLRERHTATMMNVDPMDSATKTSEASNPFIARLQLGADLSADDRSAIGKAVFSSRWVRSGVEMNRQGELPSGVFVVLDGMVARYKDIASGKRQIIALLVPGDFCDVDSTWLAEMDDGLFTLKTSRLATISRRQVEAWRTDRPAICEAMNGAGSLDKAILREWLVNIGGRPALVRAAHLFCELGTRLKTAGVISDTHEFDSGLNQTDLGRALGLSVVHVNRVLGKLRTQGLLHVQWGRVQIPDFGRLAEVAEFRSNYLHTELQHRKAERVRSVAHA